MSGIYIPGLAMPTNCLDCPVYWDKCPNFETEGEEYLERIHPDCPLVPVPEHGRLIDADAIDWVEGRDEQDRPVYLLLKVQIDDIPTIIQASGGNEDE